MLETSWEAHATTLANAQSTDDFIAAVNMRRGPYFPHLYIVKEDGEPHLRLWALSALIQDRADVLPSYQQFVNTLKEKVSTT